MKRHTGYGWLELIEGILLIILGALAIAVITISCINIAQQVMMMPGPVLY